jgi:hypothetical protein
VSLSDEDEEVKGRAARKAVSATPPSSPADFERLSDEEVEHRQLTTMTEEVEAELQAARICTRRLDRRDDNNELKSTLQDSMDQLQSQRQVLAKRTGSEAELAKARIDAAALRLTLKAEAANISLVTRRPPKESKEWTARDSIAFLETQRNLAAVDQEEFVRSMREELDRRDSLRAATQSPGSSRSRCQEEEESEEEERPSSSTSRVSLTPRPSMSSRGHRLATAATANHAGGMTKGKGKGKAKGVGKGKEQGQRQWQGKIRAARAESEASTPRQALLEAKDQEIVPPWRKNQQ